MSDRTNAREYFRSLEQMAGSPEVAQRLENEFPGYTPKDITSKPRRDFLKLMGATMAVAGVTLTGCRRWPKEHLVPTTAGLRDQMPGVPEIYATSFEQAGVATPVIVTSYDGRPIKVEGNPLHPMMTTWRKADGTPLIGGSDVFAQASVLELYDPVRTRSVILNENDKQTTKKWDDFFAAFDASVAAHGAGSVAVLSESSSSLTFAGLRQRFAAKFSGSTWVEYEPLSRDEESQAGQDAFGRAVRANYNLATAKVIVSLDSDLFGTHPNKVRFANDWAQGRRKADGDAGAMNRLYIAESCFSTTGTNADHRLPIKPSQLAGIASAIAAEFGIADTRRPELTPAQNKWVDAVVADLRAAGKAGVVTVGLQAPARIQALAYAINFKLGAVGTTVTFHETGAAASQVKALQDLCRKMADGQVSTLLILGGNPVYDAPADLNFAQHLGHVAFRAHLGLFADETSRKCNWHLPRSHYLEAWGDARAWDGSVCLQQPLIMPLYDSKTAIEVLAGVLKEENTDGQTLVRRMMAASLQAAGNDAGWQKSLHDGFVADSAFPAAQLNAPASIGGGAGSPVPPDRFEVRFLPSAQTLDGRFANNPWLVECPDPVTKLVWDNAALLNKTDADKLGVAIGDLIEVSNGNASVKLPAFILWGQPAGVIGLTLGFGRTAAGPVGGDPTDSFGTAPVGFDVYPIRRTDGMAAIREVQVKSTGDSHDLVSTQDYQPLDWPGMKGYEDRVGNKGEPGRVVRETTLANYIEHPDFVDHVVHRLPLQQLWDSPYGVKRENDPDAPQAFNNPHAWGMSIDMSTCIGCNACVVACQSENNIPTVGKQMVRMNREMHWLRIDRYLKPKLDESRHVANDDYENVDVVHMPMMCVHCENAPCEQVCPVAATVHDTEGLNTMVYNRCIGTRYCSNNCPYKVRRFNYMDWHSRNPRADGPLGLLNSAWLGIPDTQQKETLKQVRRMVYNPEVTVRMRGVMEKCTYCTQRIKAKTINKKNEWAKGHIPHEPKPNGQPAYTVDDFEVVTACQQACPTQAITFGNLLDKGSSVRQQHALPRAYTVLEDLNTRARTRHLAKIRNLNESLADTQPTRQQGRESETHAGDAAGHS